MCFTGVRDSSVGIATGYGLDGPGIESRWGARFFAHVQNGPGAHPASCTAGTGSFPGVKWPGRGADHPPPSSAEVKKELELYLYPPLWAFESVTGYIYLYVCFIIASGRFQSFRNVRIGS
jgi:hypothetical protein